MLTLYLFCDTGGLYVVVLSEGTYRLGGGMDLSLF